MKVKELIGELLKCPKDADVCLVDDWSDMDDNGVVHSLKDVSGIIVQEFNDHVEVIIEETSEVTICR